MNTHGEGNMIEACAAHLPRKRALRAPVTDLWSLREIYRRKLRRMRRYGPEICEDLASEMLSIALELQRTRGIAPQNCTVRWLLGTARQRVIGHWRWTGYGYCEYSKSPSYPVLSDEEFDEWLSANWLSFSSRNNGQGKPIARYRVFSGDAEIVFDGRELGELLRSEGSKLKDAQLVANLLKRGRNFWMMDGRLFPTLSHAKRELGLAKHEACPGFEVRITAVRIPDIVGIKGRVGDFVGALPC